MEHIGEAANLLPILRARICGYTGIFRVAESFWQRPKIPPKQPHGQEDQTKVNKDQNGKLDKETISRREEEEVKGREKPSGFFASFFN